VVEYTTHPSRLILYREKPPHSIGILACRVLSGDGVLPPEVRAEWEYAYGEAYPADRYSKPESELLKEAAAGATMATEYNNIVTKEFVPDRGGADPTERVAPEGVITRKSRPAKAKVETGLGKGTTPADRLGGDVARASKEARSVKEFEDKKKDTQSRIGKLENEKARLKKRIRKSDPVDSALARKMIRSVDAKLKTARNRLTDLGGKPNPKALSSAPLTTRPQTEKQVQELRTKQTDVNIVRNVSDKATKVVSKLPAEDRKPDNFYSHMAFRENSSRWGNDKQLGGKEGTFNGAFQMGIPSLVDAGFLDFKEFKKGNRVWTKEAKAAGVTSIEDFLKNPKAQVTAVRAFHKSIEHSLTKGASKVPADKLKAVEDMTLKDGTKITRSGILAASHLVGGGKVRAALKSKDPIAALEAALDGAKGDKVRTSALEYIKQFSGHF